MWQKEIPDKPDYYWIYEPYKENEDERLCIVRLYFDEDGAPDIYYTASECPMGSPWPPEQNWFRNNKTGQPAVWWWDEPVPKPWISPPRRQNVRVPDVD